MDLYASDENANRDHEQPLDDHQQHDIVPIAFHDDETAPGLVSNMIHDIEESFASVRARIEEYGSAIAKRWQKWTSARREDVLRNTTLKIYPRKDARMEILF